MKAAPPATLLAPAELAALGRLGLVHRRPQRGNNPGERRSPRSARSPEFADFRPFSRGDDLRQVDWRAYARLDRLVVRLHVAEEEAALNVIVDASASMGLGSPPKWPAARRVAAALATLGLIRMDRVTVGVLARGGPCTGQLGRAAGAGRVAGFLLGLEPQGAAGPADLSGLRWLRPGLTVVVSDFLVGDPWDRALSALRAGRQEPVLWQVLSPDEEHPRLTGDLKLREAESGRLHDVTITARVVEDYLAKLAEHRDGLRRQATAAGGRFLHTSSDGDLRTWMTAAAAAGVVRRA